MYTAKSTTLYARATAALDDRVERALGLLVEAAENHAGRIVQASSLGAEDQVVTDLIARYRLPITVATLDTGKLHGETLALIGAVRALRDRDRALSAVA
jgi:phosphoadenosine phosphosulfate reductase